MAEDGFMSDAVPLAVLIRRRRHAASLTQEELAQKAGISLRTISDIERGLRRFVYRDTAERLAEALQVTTAERDAFVAVARGRVKADEPSSRPGGQHESLRLGHIPVPATPLVGREHEMEKLLAALQDPTMRLITLTGPGGIGKSRLAAEAAIRVRDASPGSVFFVQLGLADSPARVAALIADVLGLPEPDDRTIADISVHLSDSTSLMFLDTFEHVLAAAASMSELLSFCDGLTLLVTSREPLRIRGEHVVPVPPLAVPPEGSSDLSASASGQLLVDRAKAAKSDLQLDEESSAVLADICRRLEGLPLAIELAASRFRHLPFIRLRDQLNARLSLLTLGGPDLPRRQRTMRATIGWSYDLLEAPERSLFRSLSVFAGGWTLEAAEKVCAAPAADVLESLSALVDKSLVALRGVQTSIPRYSMMDVIAEFAAEQRDRFGETENVLRSHLAYFVAFAERAEDKFGTAAQEDSYAELLADHDNLRAALRWSVGGGDSQTGLRLAAALWQFWRAVSYLSEGRSWLEDAIDSAVDAPNWIRAKASWGACWLALQQDDLRSARHYSDELLALTRLDESLERRNALTVQGMLYIAEGRYIEAAAVLERSVALAEASGSRWYLATSKLNLAIGQLHLRRLGDAERLLGEALHVYEQIGDERFVARALSYRAHAALQGKNPHAASGLFYDALQRATQVNDEGAIASALEGLAAASAATDAPKDAALLVGAARRAREGAMSKTLPFERPLIDAWFDEARDALGDEQWTALLERGAGLDNQEVLALVEQSTDV
jgi:predicted ATPase/DNA-binding XRE family transcriptional regulator